MDPVASNPTEKIIFLFKFSNLYTKVQKGIQTNLILVIFTKIYFSHKKFTISEKIYVVSSQRIQRIQRIQSLGEYFIFLSSVRRKFKKIIFISKSPYKN